MDIPLFQVDAFTSRPFAGNPAAVAILDRPMSDAWMQAVGREMNLSETAFLERRGAEAWGLRWFTPTVEVDLCGHATLASAHVLWEQGYLAEDAEARFHTRSGLLTARRDGDWIVLDLPADRVAPVEAPGALVESLGTSPLFVGRSTFDYFVELTDEATVTAIRPDFRRMAALEARGVIVTAGAAREGDFVSRFFAPASGVDEDPVTGSAHCALATFWAERLGRTRLVGRQVSARGGLVRVALLGDRVAIAGMALTVMHGTLLGES